MTCDSHESGYLDGPEHARAGVRNESWPRQIPRVAQSIGHKGELSTNKSGVIRGAYFARVISIKVYITRLTAP
jgi:hypothetical protein